MNPIRLSAHATGYMARRGFTLAEVEAAIRSCAWQTTKMGRKECRKDFRFGKEWNGKRFATKQVRPVFVEEATEIVVVTVYTFIF